LAARDGDDGLRPGDDYNQRTTWDQILVPHGWTHIYDHGPISYWRRPGASTRGVDATTNVHGTDRLKVFSTSTSFETDTTYDRFGAYAALQHGGDLTAAARALSAAGYGQPGKSRPMTRDGRPEWHEVTNPPEDQVEVRINGTQRPTTTLTAPQLDPAALHGIAGDVVDTFRPHTEACDAALLVPLLVQAGNYIGRGPHVMVESDRHGCSLFAVLVGESARARKGTAAGRVQAVMNLVDVDGSWSKDCIVSGFGSGEGVIATLDNNTRSDPRLLVDERELSMLLTVASREGSILSSVLRNGWDGQPLRSRTKGNKLQATDYHLSALGHITRPELGRLLTSTEQSNGFANRFLWVHTERARRLPHGGDLDPMDLIPPGCRLKAAVETAGTIGAVGWTVDAYKRWEEIYETIGDAELPGIAAVLTNRAEAQVLRLALIYAVLDGCDQIGVAHLVAAWALWRYCEDSVLYIWGDASGDRDLDRLVTALRQIRPAGLTVTEANSTIFAGHKPVGPIAARGARYGLIRIETEQGPDGRARGVLYAT
jgi:hypothetical protein